MTTIDKDGLHLWVGEGLPEIAVDITVKDDDLLIRLLDDRHLVLNLQTLQLKEQILV